MAKAAHTTNDFDGEVVRSLLSKIDGFDVDLLSERGSYMAACRGIRESIAAVYDEAKAHGVPKKELQQLVKIRKKEAEAKKLYEALEADQQENLKRLAATEKVADLPLWRSAKERKPVPGVDIARTAAGEREPMWKDDDPQGLKNAKFEPLR